ncbi:MAG: putative sulfate exporter family transporter [Thermomicrobiales bacterium]
MNWLQMYGPGIAVSAAITLVAIILARIEEEILGYALLEPLVLALILGIAIRSLWQPSAVLMPGINFAAKQLLEIAIVLLGASLDLHKLVEAGAKLVIAVLISVTVTILVGTTIGRAAGLAPRLAILVAVGNAICGNSAIAAVAPAIKAKRQEIASAIALTAVFGVGVVLVLPLLVPVLGLSNERYGVVAGLAVYAVPQVLAATFPVSAESGQIGSIVKLTRVLLLGPTVAIFAWIFRDRVEAANQGASGFSLSKLTKFLPWFVIGFAMLAILRTTDVIPDTLGTRTQDVSKVLTAIAMTALGLTVDVRSVRQGGARVALVIACLTGLLVVMALTLVTVLGIG